jgi:hypothetical protein
MHLLYSIANPALPMLRQIFLLLVILLGLSQTALAYTLTCDVQGSFPELEKISIEPATVKVEITSIGDHLYIKMDGPKLFTFFVNTLKTPEFEGMDLTSKTSIWVKRKNMQTMEESEVKINREPVNIKAIKDVQRYGKKLKFFVTGPCQLPPG